MFVHQVSPQEQAETHLLVARGLAAVYTLFAKTAGMSGDSFQKDLVRLAITTPPLGSPDSYL